MASTSCKYFRSDAGCKARKACKWSHSDHRKTECKLKAHGKSGSGKDGQRSTNEPGPGPEGGKTKSASSYNVASTSSTGNTSSSGPVKIQEMEAGVEGNQGVQGGDQPSSDKGGETGATSTTSEALMQEATKLLKSLRAPQLRAIQLSQLDHEVKGMVRPARSPQEWQEATPTQVTLADGITDKLRLKQDSKVLLSAPSDEEWSQSWIIPLGGIAELGYKIEWKNALCSLSDEEGRELPVVVHHGCPMVPRDVGQAMIDRLEKQQIRLLRKAQLLKSMMMDPSVEMMQSIQQSKEMALTYKLKTLFKALPDDILMRVIPDLTDLQSMDGNRLPWNRRKRRRLERAKQIVVHLFSGPDSKY